MRQQLVGRAERVTRTLNEQYRNCDIRQMLRTKLVCATRGMKRIAEEDEPFDVGCARGSNLGGDLSAIDLPPMTSVPRPRQGHTRQCSTELNCGYGNLLRIELESSRAGRQDKKHPRPSGEAPQRICREARLRPDSGACRFGYQGRGPRVHRSETRGAPVALRSAARDGRSL